jgi:hypothetical protein
VVPAELREELAPQRHEVVSGHRSVWVRVLQREAAIHPGERLVPLASRLQQGGDREAVLGRQLRLFAQRDVGPDIALPGVDRAEHVTPAAARLRGVASGRVFERLLVGIRRLEAGLHVSLEGSEPARAHRLHGIALQGWT